MHLVIICENETIFFFILLFNHITIVVNNYINDFKGDLCMYLF
jgi:hypothetical protein